MAAKKEITFEKALSGLEELVEKLESDDLSLEQALEYFEKGVSFMRTCDAHLKSADGKISQLLENENGEVVEKILGSTSAQTLRGDAIDE